MSFRLLALPFTLIADAVTFGQSDLTHSLLQLERNDQQVEAYKAALLAKRLEERDEE